MEIRAELEDITSVKKKLSVEVPAEAASEEFERLAQDYREYAKVPGFRPGKAPLQLIKRKFASDIRGEVIKKLIPESLEEALRAEGVRPLGYPSLENVTAEEGKPLAYEASFEIRPVVELPEYKGLEISVEDKPVAEEDIQEQLERLREQNAQLIAVEDRPVQDGDEAMIDLKGEYLDVEPGQETQAIAEENIIVQVGDEGTHPSFTENVTGLNIGEEKSFEVEYPEDYPEKKLAGHRVQFTAEVTDIKCKKLPELSDDFAKDLGSFESLNDLRTRIEGDLAATRGRERDAEIRKSLLNKLIGQTSFEVPEVLVEARTRERIEGLAGRIASQGIDPSRANIDWRKIQEDMQQDVVDEIRGRLILDELASQEEIEVSPEEITEEIKKAAESMGQPVEKVQQYFSEPDQLAGLQADLRRSKALAIIVDGAKIN
ncbi:MAG TPA: trigger factor [Acidobacteriota bacterium]|nr:trigger factor [Acidobacteriota bacterium]